MKEPKENPWKRAVTRLTSENLRVLAAALLLDLKGGADVEFVSERLFIILDELASRLRLMEPKEIPK